MKPVRLLSIAFLEAHPADAARLLEGLPTEDAALFLSEVPVASCIEVFHRMAPMHAALALERMSPEHAAVILGALDLYVAAGIVRLLENEHRTAVLAAMPQDSAEPLTLLLSYPEGTAGAWMDPRILTVPDDISVGEALERVRHAHRTVLDYLYVVRRDRVLVGVVRTRDLMLAPANNSIMAVARTTLARLSASAPRGAILAHPRWRDLHTLPVVDDAGVFLGVIRHRTFRQLAEDAATEQIRQHPAAVLLSFGELYWVGLKQMIALTSETMRRSRAHDETDDGTRG